MVSINPCVVHVLSAIRLQFYNLCCRYIHKVFAHHSGPAVRQCLCLQEAIAVPPVELPPFKEHSKMEMPTGLKQRWKPFGYSEALLIKFISLMLITLKPHAISSAEIHYIQSHVHAG